MSELDLYQTLIYIFCKKIPLYSGNLFTFHELLESNSIWSNLLLINLINIHIAAFTNRHIVYTLLQKFLLYDKNILWKNTLMVWVKMCRHFPYLFCWRKKKKLLLLLQITIKIIEFSGILTDHPILARFSFSFKKHPQIVHFAVPADAKVKVKEREKLGPCQRAEKVMDHEGDSDTNHSKSN